MLLISESPCPMPTPGSLFVPVGTLILAPLLLGIVNAFDFPVRQAFVAELVPREDLISAVTLNSSMINSVLSDTW